jgi:hypothetical protein
MPGKWVNSVVTAFIILNYNYRDKHSSLFCPTVGNEEKKCFITSTLRSTDHWRIGVTVGGRPSDATTAEEPRMTTFSSLRNFLKSTLTSRRKEPTKTLEVSGSRIIMSIAVISEYCKLL